MDKEKRNKIQLLISSIENLECTLSSDISDIYVSGFSANGYYKKITDVFSPEEITAKIKAKIKEYENELSELTSSN